MDKQIYNSLMKMINSRPVDAIFGKFDKELLMEGLKKLFSNLPNEFKKFTLTSFVEAFKQLEDRY